MSRTVQTLLLSLRGGTEAPGSTTDVELLERFSRDNDGAAFAAIVERHGSMVLGVCRRVLHDATDVDDAFQVVFLVLARKARTLGHGVPVGAWLHGVAWRTATHARADRIRRRMHERRATAMAAVEPSPAVLWEDLRPILDEEVERLPAKYRAPVVLCYLQGKTYDEAAREIGCPKGTVATRLVRAREMLRTRLVGRGIALPSALMVGIVAERAGAAVPVLLKTKTVESVTSAAASAGFSKLANEVIRAMSVATLKKGTTLLVAIGLLSAGSIALMLGAIGTDTTTVSAGQVPPRSGEKPKGSAVVEALADEPTWSEPSAGLQIRLRPLKTQWKFGDTPTFHIDLRNQAKRHVEVIQRSEFFEVEFDGTWYGRKLEKASIQGTMLKPGEETKDYVALGLYPLWLRDVRGGERYTSKEVGQDLPLTPGKHRIRVAYRPSDKLSPVSAVVEIEIFKPEKK